MDTSVWGYVLALFMLTVALAYYVYLGWKIDCLNGTRVKLWNFKLWNSQNSCFQPAVKRIEEIQIHVASEKMIFLFTNNKIYALEYDPSMGWKIHLAVDALDHIKQLNKARGEE